MKPIAMWNIYPSDGQNGAIYDSRGISPTILSGQGGGKVEVSEVATRQK